MARDAERSLAACRELRNIVVVASDGCDVFRLCVWDGKRRLRQDPEIHSMGEFASVKTPTPRWLQWFSSLRNRT